jgi:hypothetical protein
MSLVENLGSAVHAASADLPVGTVTAAAQRLRVGLELLEWVRQTSVHEVGVAALATATEHLEEAAYALRVAQDSLAAYLAAIGLGYDAAPGTDNAWREGLGTPPDTAPPAASEPDAAPLRHWWTVRVDMLTGHPVQEPARDDDAGPEPAGEPAELLRRVVDPVRAGDRERLRGELRGVPVPVGLGLSAISAPVARHLATELLGHEPSAKDLAALAGQAREPMRRLLPALPEEALASVIARVCRVTPKGADRDGGAEAAATHPTDSAVAGAVLVAVLMHRLGRGPDSLAREIEAAREEAGERARPVRPARQPEPVGPATRGDPDG